VTMAKEETRFWVAPDEVAQMASDIMDAHHEGLVNAGVGIVFLFRDPPKESQGRTELGCVKRIPEHLRTFCDDCEFAIIIASKPWDDMPPARRAALLDHELQHIVATKKKDGTWKLSTRKHDLGDFVDVIQRRGFWAESDPVKQMFQKVLFAEAKPAEPPEAKKGKKGEAA